MVRLFHRENECYVCAEGSFADDGRVVDRENECYIPPEGSQVEGDVVQLFHPENEPAEGTFTNGGDLINGTCMHAHALMKPPYMYMLDLRLCHSFT